MIKPLQTVLQWLFMRVEALFNRAFGDRLNPLYHLGAISFFLFWIIAGTGLYLYAFFETGVADAYASVESITHTQWFAGGILRSVHRYASDAFVFTMLLHMRRYFAFNRYRGFRWFSWATGVALIWLVYVTGINGYMLSWDQMAQFVIVTSFEWLDALPTFGGTLMRNFIYPHSVNDRFFSLLAFMHIGISLIILLVMWVHVQRVPKAKTTPPKPIIFSLSLTLLVLSLLQPALSQGGAATLNVAVTHLNFDWFYLSAFPFLYSCSLSQIWGVALGVSALLFLLPWLPPQFRKKNKGEFHLTIADQAQQISVRPGETLLDAGLRQNITLPYECRNGGCGLCLCTVLHGQVEQGAYQVSVLSDAMRQQGQALMCCATPLSDLEIEVTHTTEQAARPVQRCLARVVLIEKLSDDLIRLQLSLPDGIQFAFVAGQYINVVLEDGQRRAFSFANPPHKNGQIELHIRWMPQGRFTSFVFTSLKLGDTLDIEGPFGNFSLSDSAMPILFVAGATGFAPIKSIVEDAFQRGIHRPMWLYWGVRKPHDLYMAELAQSWQTKHSNFHFVPVISEAEVQDNWHGRQGLVHHALLHDFPDLSGHEVYVCGSVKMVETAIPAFIAHGLGDDACFSDAFLPAQTNSNSQVGKA